jgi:hypothetical protein
MPLPAALIAGAKFGLPLLASGVAGFFGNKKKTTTQTSTPSLDPKFGPLQSMLMEQTMGRLRDGGMPKGYETGQIGEINNTFDLIGQRQGNDLTARGLGSSPVAGIVDANREQARGGEIVRMQRQIPQMARDNQLQDLMMSMGLLGQGRGNTTTQTDPGNPMGGAFSNFASMLGLLMGQGQLGNGMKLPGQPVNVNGLG